VSYRLIRDAGIRREPQRRLDATERNHSALVYALHQEHDAAYKADLLARCVQLEADWSRLIEAVLRRQERYRYSEVGQ
jgi:hypothetical protein